MAVIAPIRVLEAAVAAGVLSGIPSSVHALATGANPFDAVRAAGTIAVGEDAPRTTRLVGGLAVHAVLSLGWTAALALVLPRRRAVAWGVAAGVGIAALDLAIAQRRFPAIAALPRGAQVADHVAFGAVVGLVLARDGARGRCRRTATRSRGRAAPG